MHKYETLCQNSVENEHVYQMNWQTYLANIVQTPLNFKFKSLQVLVSNGQVHYGFSLQHQKQRDETCVNSADFPRYFMEEQNG